MNQQEHEELQQQLLELHYGLLEQEQVDQLQERIREDEVVAQQWIITQSFVGKLKDVTAVGKEVFPKPDYIALADKIADPKVSLDSSSQQMVAGNRRVNSFFWASSWAMIAAMIGFLIVGRGYLMRLPSSPTAKIGLELTPLSLSQAERNRGYQVATSLVDHSAVGGNLRFVPANLSFRLLSPSGVLFSGSATSDQRGLANILIPDHLVIPPNTTLRVVAKTTEGVRAESSLSLTIPRTRSYTYLTTDRPVYRPGELIYFRSLTLNRKSLQPVSGFPIEYMIRSEPSRELDETAYRMTGVTQRGVGNGSFQLRSDMEPGNYELVVRSLDSMFPDEKVPVQVRNYRTPQIDQQVRWKQPSFKRGESLEALLELRSLVSEGPRIPDSISAGLLLDGVPLEETQFPVNQQGIAAIALMIPERDFNLLQLQVTTTTGTTSESQLIEVPVQRGDLVVHFYPEGGDLSTDLLNRVYFSAEDAKGKPVDCQAELFDQNDRLVSAVKTMQNGLGRFDFVPAAEMRYWLKVKDSGSGEVLSFKLPGARKGFPVLDTQRGVYQAGASLKLMIRSVKEEQIAIQVGCRGRVVAEQLVDLMKGENEIEIPVSKESGGVMRVTLLQGEGSERRPIAERLVYRRPDHHLVIECDELVESNPVFASGQRVQLGFRVHDESGKAKVATLGVSVVDEAARSLKDSARPSLETQFILLSEIARPSDLENADFYLGTSEVAEQGLDLLLGTQGWRRFVSWSEAPASDEFQQLLTRLVELDGGESDEPSQVGNTKGFVSDWLVYRQALDASLAKAWVDLRYVAASVLATWCAVFVWHRRRQRSQLITNALLSIACLCLIGCGAEQMPSTERLADTGGADTGDAAANMANTGDAPGAQPAMEMMEIGKEGHGDHELSEGMGARMSPMIQRSEAPPDLPNTVDSKWIDWLPEQKVAWLLKRVAEVRKRESEVEQDTVNPSVSGDNRSISEQQILDLLPVRGMTAQAATAELIKQLQFPVREYAHQRQIPDEEVGGDYQETIFWHPLLETNEEGFVTIEFELPDSLTTFRIHVDGHTFDGRIGSFADEFITVQQSSPDE